MKAIYNVDQNWLLDRPKEILRFRIIASVLTTLVIIVSWFIGKWVFVSAVVLGLAYLGFEFYPRNLDLKDLYVKVQANGLLRSAPNTNGGDAITMLTPWSYLSIDSVTRKRGNTKIIRLIDNTLPKGVRTIKIEKLEKMDELLNDIRNKTQSTSA